MHLVVIHTLQFVLRLSDVVSVRVRRAQINVLRNYGFRRIFLWFLARRRQTATILSARQHVERAICYRKSVRLSVCLSHGWISRKRLNLGSCNFHHTVAPSLSCLWHKFHPEIPTGSPERGRQTRLGWGNELIRRIVGVLTLSPGGSKS